MTITKQPWSSVLSTTMNPSLSGLWALLHGGLIHQKCVQFRPGEQGPLWLFPSPSLRFLGEIPMSWGPVLKSIGRREGHRVSGNLPQTTQVTETSETYVAQGSKAPHPCPSLDGAKDTSTQDSGHAFMLVPCVSVSSATM